MQIPRTLPPVRQQKFEFEPNEAWKNLPPAVREETLAQLVQMLQAVRHHLHQTGSDDHERQDSI